jgi:heptosyltransferase-2/heptosyltransferase-3
MRIFNQRKVAIARMLERVLRLFHPLMRVLLPPHPEREVRRILVFEPFLLGDFIMATPAFRFLRQHFPGVRIDCVGPPALEGLEPFFPWLDEIIPFRCPWSPAYRHWSLANLRQTWRLIRKLRHNRYDWAFDLRGDVRDILFIFLAGATRRAAFAITGGEWLLTDVVPYEGQPYRHQLEGNLLVVTKPLAVQPGPEHFACALEIPRKWREAATAWLRARGLEQFIAVHPAASRAHQRWPAASWIKLLDTVLLPRSPVVLFGAPQDGPVITEIAGGLRLRERLHCAQVPLELFFALTSMARAMVCLDSGAAHVAAAAGTPVVVLHGPRPASLSGAYAAAARPVYLEDVPCRPCGRWCTQPRNFCMQDLPVALVEQALHELHIIE